MNTQAQKLTREEREGIARAVINAMQDAYKAEGETGDFDDGFRYLSEDVSDDELLREEEKWCKQT